MATLSNIIAEVALKATSTLTVDGATAAVVTQGEEISYSFTSGTTSSKADGIWADTGRTVTSGNAEDIDVYDLASFNIGAGAGLDAHGQARTHAEVCGIVVENRSTSAGTLLVGGKGTTAAWNSIFNGNDDAELTLPPGTVFALISTNDPAFAVADTSNHLLTMTASGGDVTYDAVLLTRSA